MNPTIPKAPTGLYAATAPSIAALPLIVAPREPGASGLTADEIRRIVLDVLG